MNTIRVYQVALALFAGALTAQPAGAHCPACGAMPSGGSSGGASSAVSGASNAAGNAATTAAAAAAGAAVEDARIRLGLKPRTKITPQEYANKSEAALATLYGRPENKNIADQVLINAVQNKMNSTYIKQSEADRRAEAWAARGANNRGADAQRAIEAQAEAANAPKPAEVAPLNIHSGESLETHPMTADR